VRRRHGGASGADRGREGGVGGDKVSKVKKFFFEKKNQKTFAPLRAVFKTPGTETNKVFLVLFVHKKNFFLPLPSLL
jgi:hypothetical protein